MEIRNQIPEKFKTNKNKKNGKNKKKNHLVEKNIIIEQLNDESQFQNSNGVDSPQSKKHKKRMKNSELYEIDENTNKNYMKEEYLRKDEKIKKRKMNSKESNNKSNISNEYKKVNNLKKKKLKNLINKLDYLYIINIMNKYYQRWILQTFDIVEEDSEGGNDNENIKNKPNMREKQEEEEEEEENDYGGDLEEIEERAPDEEESVITSVHSKTKIKRANDILFALRKIIKYKNIFFRYFIRWYNAVDINAPTNEYKKIRKEKKLSSNITNINTKKNMININSNINNINIIELKNPIYEVSSEEKPDEVKSDVKANLKNIIELKGTKKTILKKYYDIWYMQTINQGNNSYDSCNNEQNEYIFTYHGNFRKNDGIIDLDIKPDKQNFSDENINDNLSDNKNKELEGYNNKEQKNCEIGNISEKYKQKAQCYIKKKIYSIKKEGENIEIKKAGKKKNKINDMLKNLFIKINYKNLLISALKKWMMNGLCKNNDIPKDKKKASTKMKKKTLNSKNKKKNQIGKLNSKDSDSSKEEKTHRKNNLSLDEYINQKDKIKNLMADNKFKPNEENQISSESSPTINLKKYYNANNPYQLNSDTSINNSINTNSNTSEMIDQLRERELGNNAKKGKKTGRNEESKNVNKNKEKKESGPIEGETDQVDMEKIKQNIEKICRTHKNKRAQRYLLVKPPKIKKSKDKKIEDRQSFSSINYSLKLEKFQKKLIKLLIKTTCRKNPLNVSFDHWFNETFNSKNYMPFLQSNTKRKVSKTKKTKKATKIKDKKDVIKKRDTSVDNINLNMNKKIKKNSNLNHVALNSFDSYEKDITKNDNYAVNNENKLINSPVKYGKIKEMLNQGFDSESSEKLLLNEKSKINDLKNASESFDAPRSIDSNKKFKKNKNDTKEKGKSKDIKKKVMKKGEKIEEGPRQRKPGKKYQYSSEINDNMDFHSPNKNHKNKYIAYEKNITFDIDNYENSGSHKNFEKINKRKKHDLSASFDVVILNKNSKKENNIHIKRKSKDDGNRKINLYGMNEYFGYKGNYQRDEEINPDVQNIEITQDDSEMENKHKKMKKTKKANGEEKEKSEDRKRTRLIKIYNRACHQLRKAIRSYKKRNKTFNPDFELKRAFYKWAENVFINNEQNEPKNELNDKELKENTKEKKVNALKGVLNIINFHNRKIKGRLSEDEENYNYIKWCFNIWIKNTFDFKEDEEQIESSNNFNLLINDKVKDNDNNDNKYVEEPENSENRYSQKNSLKNEENIHKNLEANRSDKKVKDKKEKKKKRNMEPDSLLDIDLEERKAKKHKNKKKKLSKTSNSINSYNSGSKKDSKELESNFKDELHDHNLNNNNLYDKNKNDKKENYDKKNEEKENEEKENGEKENEGKVKDDIKMRNKNFPKEGKGFANKNSFENKNNNNNKNIEIEINKRENKKIKNEEKKFPKEINNLKRIFKNEENIFQKIKKEFPTNDGFSINTDYIKDKEDKDIKEEEENPGVPKKIQAPPQVIALMKKKGKRNLPLPSNNLRISYREFGKGNLEIVEPGELVSSERLKMVKKNLKRNLTCNSEQFSSIISNINSGPLNQSSYFKNDAFNLNNNFNPKKQEEINKALNQIFHKKDEGLFARKKYFKKWVKNANSLKPHEINLNIRPQVKKAYNTPIIFLTKSLEENNDDEKEDSNSHNEEENNKVKNNRSNRNIGDKNINIGNEEKKKSFDDKILDNNNEKEKMENNIRFNRNEPNRINRNDIKPLDKMKKYGEEEENKEEGGKGSNNINKESNENPENEEMIKIKANYDEENQKNQNDNRNLNYINDMKRENKEIKIDPKDREKNIKKIYKLTKEINKANNNTFNIIKNSPNFNMIVNEYTNFLNEQNRRIKAYKLYLLYSQFNEDYAYFLKRNTFYRWKKGNKIFKDVFNKNHLKLYDEHCISCSCDDENYSAVQTVCLNCNCDEIKTVLKNVLINYKFLKELNPVRYYFYLWYKNVFF